MTQIPVEFGQGGVPGGFVQGVPSPNPQGGTVGARAASSAAAALGEIGQRMVEVRNQRLLTERETQLLQIENEARQAALAADPAEAESVFTSTFEQQANPLLQDVPDRVQQELQGRIEVARGRGLIKVRNNARKRDLSLLVEQTNTQIAELQQQAVQADSLTDFQTLRTAAVGAVDELAEFIPGDRAEALRRTVQQDFDGLEQQFLESRQELAEDQLRRDAINVIADPRGNELNTLNRIAQLRQQFESIGLGKLDAKRAANDTARVAIQERAFRLIDAAGEAATSQRADDLLAQADRFVSDPSNRRLFDDPQDLRAVQQDVQDAIGRVRQQRELGVVQAGRERLDQIVGEGFATPSELSRALDRTAENAASVSPDRDRESILNAEAARLATAAIGQAPDNRRLATAMVEAAKSRATGTAMERVQKIGQQVADIAGRTNTAQQAALNITAALTSDRPVRGELSNNPEAVNRAYSTVRSQNVSLPDAAGRLAEQGLAGAATDMQQDVQRRFDPDDPQSNLNEGIAALRAISDHSQDGDIEAMRVIDRFDGTQKLLARALFHESQHLPGDAITALTELVGQDLGRSVTAMQLAVERQRGEGGFADQDEIDLIDQLNRVASRAGQGDEKFGSLPPAQRQKLMDSIRLAGAKVVARGGRIDDPKVAADAVRLGIENFNRRVGTVRVPEVDSPDGLFGFGAVFGRLIPGRARAAGASPRRAAADRAALGINDEATREAFERFLDNPERSDSLRRAVARQGGGDYRPALTDVFTVPGRAESFFPVYQNENLAMFVGWNPVASEGVTIERSEEMFGDVLNAFTARTQTSTQTPLSSVQYDPETYQARSVAGLSRKDESGGSTLTETGRTIMVELNSLARDRFRLRNGRPPRPSSNEADMRALLQISDDIAREAGWPEGLNPVVEPEGDDRGAR